MDSLTKLFYNSVDLMLYSDDRCIKTFTSFIVYKLLDKKYNLTINPDIKLIILEKNKNNKDIITNIDYLSLCYNILNDYIARTNDIELQLLLIFIIQLLMKNKYKLQLSFNLIQNIMLIKLNIIERFKIHKVLIESNSKNIINSFIIKIINKTNLLL
jgi:hypothetical protein